MVLQLLLPTNDQAPRGSSREVLEFSLLMPHVAAEICGMCT